MHLPELTIVTALALVAAAGGALAVGTLGHLLVNIGLRRRLAPDAQPFSERVAVLIPMRDEEEHAAAVLATVLGQQDVTNMRVIVCDDGSVDATSAIVAEVAALDERVTLMTGEPLPAGWLGKPWACTQLREAAGDVDVLVFIDADVRLAPSAVTSAAATLRRHHLALLSPFPRQDYSGLRLSLFQPLLQWAILAMLPLRLMERKARTAVGRSLAAGNGQFLVIDAATYDRMGGHGTVRAEVVEDVMLTQAVKAAGGRVCLTPAPEASRCRMYTTTEGFIEGYSKSLWRAFGSPARGVGVLLLFAWQYLLPVAGLALSPAASMLWWICLAGVAAGVLGRIASALVTRDSLWAAFLHPMSVLVFGWLMAESLRRKWRGTLTWRGRLVG